MTAMKLAVKTLQKGGSKNETFDVEVVKEDTIIQVKEKIEGLKPEFEAASAKLICAGRVLVNEKTVEESSLKEGDFLVIIPGKKTEPAATTTAAPAATTTTTTPAATDSGAADNNANPTPAAPVAAATATNSREHEAAITQLTEMGFPREQCEQALRAAFGNADRAVEYLFNGIPQMQEVQMGGGEGAPNNPFGAAAPAGGEEQQGGDAAQDDQANSGAQGFHGAAFPSMEGGGNAGPAAPQGQAAPAAGGALAGLANDPMFAQLRMMVQQNPAMLQQVLAQLAQSNPQLLQLISQNQQEFMQLMQQPVDAAQMGAAGGGLGAAMAAAQGGGGAPQGMQMPALTADDEAAVTRLQELANTSREMALQAYFACEKNEEHAANFLFENMDF